MHPSPFAFNLFQHQGTNIVQGSNLSTSSPILYYFPKNSNSSRYEVISYCGFDLCVSLKMKWTSELPLKWHWVSSHILLDVYICSLEKCLFKSLAHFKIRFFFFVVTMESQEFLILHIFWKLSIFAFVDCPFCVIISEVIPRPMSRGSSSMFFLGILQFQVLCLSL